MTYRNLAPWPPVDEFVLMPLADRIKFVRTNLERPTKGGRVKHLTLDEFAAAVGAKDRARPIGWEKGQKPRDYAKAIAELTPYTEAAFGGSGAEALVEESLGRRLRSLTGEVAFLRTNLELVLEALGIPAVGEPPTRSEGVVP